MHEDNDLGQVAVARTAQLASVIAMVAENTTRMRTARQHAAAMRDEHAARTT